MRKLSRRHDKGRMVLGLIVPSLLAIGFTFILPICYVIFLSLHNYNILMPSHKFVAFSNYLRLLRDLNFWYSLKVTLYFAFVGVTVEVVLALLIALFLNLRFRGQLVLRTILLLPWAVPWVINGIMWKWIFNPRFGALNALLQQLGIIKSYQVWLGRPFLALNMMILADVWKETPFIAVLLLAGLQALPKELYEAAMVEGAGAWKRFWAITLPLLRPVLFVALTLRAIWSLKTFDLVFALTQGGPSGGTNLLNYYIYNISFSRLDFGYGSAISVVFVVLILGITVGCYKLVFREVQYSGR